MAYIAIAAYTGNQQPLSNTLKTFLNNHNDYRITYQLLLRIRKRYYEPR